MSHSSGASADREWSPLSMSSSHRQLLGCSYDRLVEHTGQEDGLWSHTDIESKERSKPQFLTHNSP